MVGLKGIIRVPHLWNQAMWNGPGIPLALHPVDIDKVPCRHQPIMQASEDPSGCSVAQPILLSYMKSA